MPRTPPALRCLEKKSEFESRLRVDQSRVSTSQGVPGVSHMSMCVNRRVWSPQCHRGCLGDVTNKQQVPGHHDICSCEPNGSAPKELLWGPRGHKGCLPPGGAWQAGLTYGLTRFGGRPPGNKVIGPAAKTDHGAPCGVPGPRGAICSHCGSSQPAPEVEVRAPRGTGRPRQRAIHPNVSGAQGRPRSN